MQHPDTEIVERIARVIQVRHSTNRTDADFIETARAVIESLRTAGPDYAALIDAAVATRFERL